MAKKKYKYDFTKDEYPSDVDWKDYNKEFDRYFADEMAKSKALSEGIRIGKIFDIVVADGYAYYEISKVFKTKVHLKWRRDLCPDRYMDHHFRDGGSFDRQDVEGYIERQEAMFKIFAKSNF